MIDRCSTAVRRCAREQPGLFLLGLLVIAVLWCYTLFKTVCDREIWHTPHSKGWKKGDSICGEGTHG